MAVARRWAPLVAAPLLLDPAIYVWMVYMVTNSMSPGDLWDGLSQHSGSAAGDGLPRTELVIVLMVGLACVCEASFCIVTLLYWPHIQRPRMSQLRLLPDAALLLIVLRKVRRHHTCFRWHRL